MITIQPITIKHKASPVYNRQNTSDKVSFSSKHPQNTSVSSVVNIWILQAVLKNETTAKAFEDHILQLKKAPETDEFSSKKVEKLANKIKENPEYGVKLLDSCIRNPENNSVRRNSTLLKNMISHPRFELLMEQQKEFKKHAQSLKNAIDNQNIYIATASSSLFLSMLFPPPATWFGAFVLTGIAGGSMKLLYDTYKSSQLEKTLEPKLDSYSRNMRVGLNFIKKTPKKL